MRILAIAALLAASVFGQTTINGSRTILGRWDASGATSTAPVKVGTLAALPATCTAGDLYWASDGPTSRKLHTCAATDTWVLVGYQVGTSAPATCAVGETFFKSDATAGQNWYFCTATNTWTQQSSFDPLASPTFDWDDFTTGSHATPYAGKLSWASGGTVSNNTVGVTNHPGLLQISSGTTANGNSRIQLAGTSGLTPFSGLQSSSGWEFVFIFRINSAIGGSMFARVGLGDNATAYDLSKLSQMVEASGTGEFTLKSCNNGTPATCNTAATGVTPVQNSWYRLKLYSESSGVIKCAISTDGGAYSTPVQVNVIATSGTQQAPIFLIGTTDTTAYTMQIDYYQHKIPAVR